MEQGVVVLAHGLHLEVERRLAHLLDVAQVRHVQGAEAAVGPIGHHYVLEVPQLRYVRRYPPAEMGLGNQHLAASLLQSVLDRRRGEA